MIELLGLPLLAGLALAAITGPVGAFIVWRKMAYFGETLSHSALLGIALGLIFEVNVSVAIFFTCIVIALILLHLQERTPFASDSLLGILSHAALAIGLICISITPGASNNVFTYLFGDILTVTLTEILAIFTVAALGLGSIIYYWRPLLSAAIDEDLAKAEGLPVKALRLLLMLILVLVIGVAMKIVGLLLITALLIIPAAGAHALSKSPEAMAGIAILLGGLAVIFGLALSYTLDTPTGPSIVVSATGLFIASRGFQARHH